MYLSKNVTVEKYRTLEEDKNQVEIADFIFERFTERYIKPLCNDPERKHGFCTMAINCLLIEALESFWKGWPDTGRKSKCAFISFFERCVDQDSELKVFSGYAEDFYEGVRCGILHQAETTNGWRIHRKGPLFDEKKKVINATRFHNEIKAYLKSYCDELKRSDWDANVWQNLRRKMKAVIEHCRTEQ